MKYIIPVIFLAVLIFAAVKKVKIFDEFSAGVKEAGRFTLTLVPTLAAIFMMCELFEASGLAAALTELVAPLFSALGIPKELAKLVLIKPLSGSGSMAYLNEILQKFGADNYISRCACVLYGSSETVFYISAVYFAGTKKKLLAPILIVLVSTFFTTVLACLLCRIM